MTQLFFSHTWRPDSLGRDNHERVLNIAKILKTKGWKIWIDEDNIINNIDSSIADGIENSDIILIFLTETYFKKVNESAKNPRRRDNCLKEWTYSNALNKLMIPIVFEPSLLNNINWPQGIISMHFGSTYFLDCIYNDSNKCANIIHNYLIKLKYSQNKVADYKKNNDFIFNNKKIYLKKYVINLFKYFSKFDKKKHINKTNIDKTNIDKTNIDKTNFYDYIDSNRSNNNDSIRSSNSESELTQSELSPSSSINNYKHNLKSINLYKKPIRTAPILQ